MIQFKSIVFSLATLIFIGVNLQTALGQSFQPTTICSGLDNPTGIAIQPGTGHVFVADSGAQRVVRIVDKKIEPVITDFSIDTYGKGPLYDIGPLSLLFIEQDLLLVGGGGKPDGHDTVSLFKIPDAGSPPIKADQVEGEAMSLPESDGVKGEGDFYSMVRTSQGVFVACNGDDAKGWLALATIDGDKLTGLTRLIETRSGAKANAPTALALSRSGYLTVGHMGGNKDVADSKLSYFDPEDGSLLGTYDTGAYDITGLALGPKRGRLFATDFHWANTDDGALVKLVRKGEDECEARIMVKLKKPTALAFAENGDLYVTLAGNTSEGAKEPNGKLVVIKGLDEDPAKSEVNNVP